jgi:hypothetical protein
MNILKYIFYSLFLLIVVTSCYDDKGSYDYLTDDEVGLIKIDTIGIQNRLALVTQLTPGQHIEFEPNVTYKNMDHLRYRWFVVPLVNGQYVQVRDGNTMTYPPADTIAHTKKLDWIVNLSPATYRFYFMAEDSITGQRAFYQAQQQYINVQQVGAKSGLYMLSEYDGQTDIDIYVSSLMLIYGADAKYPKYYSAATGNTIPGKPLLIKGTHTGATLKNGYLVFTDQTMLRLNNVGLQQMNNWSSSFYDVPSYTPQSAVFMNSADFLVNDGKLYTLYTNKTNDRKFSAPIAGDYVAGNYLAHGTKASYRPVSGAITADQVIYDTKNMCFRPYYAYGTSVSSFKTTSASAYLDANKLPANPVAIFNGYAEYTYCIVPDASKYYLYMFNFYNRVDNGDLSAYGSRSKIDLSGCENIANAKLYASNNAGYAFFYATDKTVYSFSPSTGQTDSKTVYNCDASEVVTAIYTWNSAGFPTAGAILWIAVWNEVTKEGKLVEYEIDNNAGIPRWMYGSSFAPTHSNPYVTTGWGKIVSITAQSAE